MAARFSCATICNLTFHQKLRVISLGRIWKTRLQICHTSYSELQFCCIRPCSLGYGILQYSVTDNWHQGPRRVKKSWGSNTHPWRTREREPIMGVWGRSPQRGSRGAEPPVGGQGAKPPEAEEVFVFKTVIFNATSATVFLHEMMYYLSCFFC